MNQLQPNSRIDVIRLFLESSFHNGGFDLICQAVNKDVAALALKWLNQYSSIDEEDQILEDNAVSACSPKMSYSHIQHSTPLFSPYSKAMQQHFAPDEASTRSTVNSLKVELNESALSSSMLLCDMSILPADLTQRFVETQMRVCQVWPELGRVEAAIADNLVHWDAMKQQVCIALKHKKDQMDGGVTYYIYPGSVMQETTPPAAVAEPVKANPIHEEIKTLTETGLFFTSVSQDPLRTSSLPDMRIACCQP